MGHAIAHVGIEGGEIMEDQFGIQTGIFVDNAMGILDKEVPKEKESRCVTPDESLSDDKAVAQVQNFVGCSFGQLLNDKAAFKNN